MSQDGTLGLGTSKSHAVAVRPHPLLPFAWVQTGDPPTPSISSFLRAEGPTSSPSQDPRMRM